jgi:uncharacterized protein DUF2442
MSTLNAEILGTALTIGESDFTVTLSDGRKLTVPYWWYPLLANATDAKRRQWRWIADGYGIHWPLIDEDLSIEGLLRGDHPPRAAEPTQNA